MQLSEVTPTPTLLRAVGGPEPDQRVGSPVQPLNAPGAAPESVGDRVDIGAALGIPLLIAVSRQVLEATGREAGPRGAQIAAPEADAAQRQRSLDEVLKDAQQTSHIYGNN